MRDASVRTLKQELVPVDARSVPPRVLIVDDDATTLRIVAATLEDQGFDVHTHEEGFGLAAAIRQFRPDLVLLDIDMPGLSGDRALEAATQVDPQMRGSLKVLLHSALPGPQLVRLSHRVGADGFIEKPVSPTEIAERICRVVPPGSAV